ncbi:MAG: SDR family oxidoreductase [Thermoleophilaceae bacterium]|jgi:NAD(P)-dependent dehydrogenase (short-subunit alcohol dehydrogenase family)
MADLDGRVVAIAGAAGGLGPVVAQTLADRGATLALGERSQDRLDGVVADLGLPEERVDGYAIDLLEDGSATAWAEHLTSRFGRIDALAHLVGGWRGGKPIAESPVEDDDWLHDLLVRTVQIASRAFLPALASSGGRFVLVSAKQAQRPTKTNAAYGAAKAAAEAWTLALADELDDSGGTSNIIVVDAIVTPRMRAENPDKDYRSFTDASEIAEAIAFLLGDGARKMNGQRLSLHG